MMENSIGYPISTISVFLGMVSLMLILDFWNHRSGKVVTLTSAVVWSSFYVVCALIYAGYVHTTYGYEASSAFLTGYVLEKVLAFDNLFVFSLIFAYFKIPEEQKHKALYWGILGAIVFRLLFVWLGVSFIDLFGSYVEVFFAVIILYTVYLMYSSNCDDDEDYNNTWYAKAVRKIYPGASTLFLCIVTIEISDVLFSFDSVPAIIAVTKDPLLIYSAMIFAILGLRSMYFIISALQRFFTYMDEAVMVVLCLIAVKLVLSSVDVHIDPLYSLACILLILVSGAVLSLILGEKNED